METEKRIRREIANSNERRRMQSINAGFQSLRTLLPRHEGEKLSKAAILQQTAEYIYSLEQEKTRLLSQNSQLKRLLSQHEGDATTANKKRKTDQLAIDDELVKRSESETSELRGELDRERRFRMSLEDQVRQLESQIYPDQIGQITLQYETDAKDVDSLALDDDDDRTSLVANVEAHLAPVSPPPLALPLEDDDDDDERSQSPSPSTRPSLLEAAIKAEPKVEVETLPSQRQQSPDPASPGEPSRLFLASTSRQNLETIVEAIRHLEGDHMFAEEQPSSCQELPLALTNKPDPQRQRLRVEMDDFLHFNGHAATQTRPGVIVVKQHS